MSVVIVGGAIIASLAVKRSAAVNTRAIAARNSVLQTTNGVRKAVWAADNTMHALMITAQPGLEQKALSEIARARDLLKGLAEDESISDRRFRTLIPELQKKLAAIDAGFRDLIDKRRDPAWVYPVLPYISGSLLEANIGFETAARLGIMEIESDADASSHFALYQRLTELRDLWRRLVLNFRAIMIRFAGLHDVDPSPQEDNVEQIFGVIENQLDVLEHDPDLDAVSFVVEESISDMERNAQVWHDEFEKVKALRRSASWRADVTYFSEKLRPLLGDTFTSLDKLDAVLTTWSSNTVSDLEHAANRSLRNLWLAAGLALLFVLGTFVMLNRLILAPIARVAQALGAAAHSPDVVSLPEKTSVEMGELIDAFESMQSQVRQRQEALEHQALHDALTGLPNRALLNDRLEHGLLNARRRGGTTGLLLLDLNRFKDINDTLGHHAGDLLLQQAAMRIATVAHEADTVARLGGDEFAVVVADMSREDLARLADSISEALDQVFELGEHSLFVGASIGAAIGPEDGEDTSTLIRHADIAMYAAKRGKRRVSFYDAHDDEAAGERLELVADLRDALEHDRLQLYYQPKVDLQRGMVVGVEALLRWDHPRRGWVPPDRVAYLAEHTGLIGLLSRWVVARALADYKTLQAHVPGGLQVSVNISPVNLQDQDFPNAVRELIARAGTGAEALVLELTEGAVMSDPVRATAVLGELSGEGAELSLDDFGTGFSSLSYLKLLPVGELKIDKSFVIDMIDDENDAAIVRSTIGLAHSLGLKVAAEGVETRAALERLAAMGCDMAQGFFIARPMPAESLVDWLGDRRVQAWTRLVPVPSVAGGS